MGYNSQEENLERIANSLHCINQNIENILKFLTEDKINNSLYSRKIMEEARSIQFEQIFNAKHPSGNLGRVTGVLATNNTNTTILDCYNWEIFPGSKYITKRIGDTEIYRWAIDESTLKEGDLPEE